MRQSPGRLNFSRIERANASTLAACGPDTENDGAVSHFQPLQLSVRTMSKQPTGAQEFVHVTCPFCGLLCDDLRIAVAERAATVLANGCTKSRRLFSATSAADAAPLMNGKPV